MIKKLLVIILAFTVVFGCFPVAFAAQGQAYLYEVYGDAMLFEQKKDAVFAGVAPDGAVIEAALIDASGNKTASAAATAANGAFEVSFTAPSGSFEEYSVVLTADGTQFARLERVVFGELWLASGQSNMMYPLIQTRTGRKMSDSGEKASEWLRVLMEPAYPEYNESDSKVPLAPQENIIKAHWIDGESNEIFSMSAVAYFFAADLMKQVNMPVGILNSSLGGSSIVSWLSRQSIDSSPEVKQLLSEKGRYIPEADWNEDAQNIYQDMSANYNLRTHALRRFRPSGLIWYQGETDLMLGYSTEEYAVLFDLLQKQLTSVFAYDGGALPIIYTHLVSYPYSDNGLNLVDWNMGFTDMQTSPVGPRAVVTVYDLLPTYLPEAGFIHPENKEDVGARMAFAAEGLVYGKKQVYSAAYMSGYEINGSSITVTFANTGDGLEASASTLYGFTVCGEDGIYVNAKAEITGSNTVRIYSDEVDRPVSAAYAYSLNNYRSNLFAACGDFKMPVSPFVTKRIEGAHYMLEKDWASCEAAELFRNYEEGFAGFSPVWKSENASISFESESAYSGKNGIRAVSDKNGFTLSPVLKYKNSSETRRIKELDADYSDYSVMSVYVRNNGTSPVSVEASLYESVLLRYTPSAGEDTSAVIPADGKWHKVEFCLNSLYLFGNEGGAVYSNNKLDYVKNIDFIFSCEGGADISLDHISFSAQKQETGTRFTADFSRCDTPFEFFSAIFTAFISLFANIFIKVVNYAK